MNLLAVDVGTTHVKAGLFGEDGSLRALATRPTPVQRTRAMATMDPWALWDAAIGAIQAVLPDGTESPASIGVAGMAETGLLVSRESGEPRSPVLPWFDPSAQPQAERLAAAGDPLERFCRTGIRPTFKCSLAKLLWLQEQGLLDSRSIWLGAAEWIVFCLTGKAQTDLSLASRTYAFDLDRMVWDSAWLERFGLSAELFPPARPAGAPAGGVVLAGGLQQGRSPLPGQIEGLAEGTPVAVCGHDHVCGAFAAGVVEHGQVFDSMGTAETLLGVLADRPLGEAEFHSGFSFGPHVVPGRRYWMGGLSASGGSIEWLRQALGDPDCTYEQMDAWLEGLDPEPGLLLFFPYLAGRGSPHSDPRMRAAFLGLRAGHRRADLLKAILEGTAYELEWIRREAEASLGEPIRAITAAGGGTRNRRWMQVKADVTGIPFTLLHQAETTLLGAALLAGAGAGLTHKQAGSLAGAAEIAPDAVVPDAARHIRYRRIFERDYLAFQEPLQRWVHGLGADPDE